MAPRVSDRLLRLFYGIASGNRTSRAMGRLSEVRLPPRVLGRVVRSYCRVFRVDLRDAVVPQGGFRTFNEFFTRRLVPEARPVDPDPDVVVSPCDGRVMATGTALRGLALQAKGRFYPVSRLLGDEGLCGLFEGGPYATIYLSPRDYHRVHVPCDGEVVEVRHLPGRLYTVAPRAADLIEELLPRNERILAVLRTPFGTVLVSMVGATGVGRMTTPFADLTSNLGGPEVARLVRLDPPVPARKGDDLGAFNVGSTVVLLLPPGPWEVLCPGSGQPVRMGEALFRWLGKRVQEGAGPAEGD